MSSGIWSFDVMNFDSEKCWGLGVICVVSGSLRRSPVEMSCLSGKIPSYCPNMKSSSGLISIVNPNSDFRILSRTFFLVSPFLCLNPGRAQTSLYGEIFL